MRKAKFIICLFLIILLCSLASFAQKKKSCKFPKSYEIGLCIIEPLTVENISGQVGDYFENKQTGKEEYFSRDTFCISLFTNKRKPVASTTPDENGFFKLKKVPDGGYFLVVREINGVSFPALIEIKIDSKTDRNKKLKVKMRAGNIDDCSFAEIQ